MKTLYLDIFSGISGDMFLGAMIDLGIGLPELEQELAKLRLDGYHLHAARKQKSNIEGVKFDVHLAHEHDHHHDPDHDHGDAGTHKQTEDHQHEHSHGHHKHDSHEGHDHGHDHSHPHEHEENRDFAEIKHLILKSTLSDWVKKRVVNVFQRIAVAEGKIHGHPPEEVHFHEVGAVDSIVDIVGACVALEMLGKPRVLSAAVVEGTGWVNCAHGRFPVPTTATLEILGACGIPITQCEEPHELVTPTGAALLAEFVESFGPMQGLLATKVGYGLGTRDNKTRPNILRAILCELTPASASTPSEKSPSRNDWETDNITVLETNLDDSPAEILGHFFEKALDEGALDVFHTPIQMKKNRPGVMLTILCASSDADKFTELMLRETSAFGVRRYAADRRKLRRELATVKTPYGEVTVKLGKLNGKVLHATPEFESCKKLAAGANVPLKRVYEAVNRVLPA